MVEKHNYTIYGCYFQHEVNCNMSLKSHLYITVKLDMLQYLQLFDFLQIHRKLLNLHPH